MKEVIEVLLEAISYTSNRRDQGDIKALAENIKEYGLRYPLLIRAVDKDEKSYMIIDGRRRFETYKLLGHERVPCIVIDHDVSPDDLALIMNTHRLNMNPVELYNVAVKYVKKDLKGDPLALPPEKIKAVAAKLNLDIDATCRILNIGRLDKQVYDLLAENKIPLRLALFTLRIPDAKLRSSFCKECLSERLSTRQAMNWIRQKCWSQKSTFYHELDNAVFDTDECKACRYRGTRDRSLFEDPANKEHDNQCWNIACYEKKENAVWQNFMKEAKEKLGLVGIKKAQPNFDRWNHHEFTQIKRTDPETCKTCQKVMAYADSHTNKIKIYCPETCTNIAKVKRDSDSSSSRDKKPTLKDRDKLTPKQKKEILDERFIMAARKTMIAEFLVTKNNKIFFVTGKLPKDYKRVLFFVGLDDNHNPFAELMEYYGKLKKNADGIVKNLDLKGLALYNLNEAARHLDSYDRSGVTVKQIDHAIELLYGISNWSVDHYAAIAEKLSKTSKELLQEVKPWKPGWAKIAGKRKQNK